MNDAILNDLCDVSDAVAVAIRATGVAHHIVACSPSWHAGRITCTLKLGARWVSTSGTTPAEVVAKAIDVIRSEMRRGGIDLPAWLASRRAERAEAERLDRLVAGVDCWDGFGADMRTGEVA